MKNIKDFDKFVNENYNTVDEGIVDFFTGKINNINDWWKKRQAGGNNLTNSEFVTRYKDKWTDEDKNKIESEAKADGFKGEVKYNSNTGFFYVKGDNINVRSVSGGPGSTGTAGHN